MSAGEDPVVVAPTRHRSPTHLQPFIQLRITSCKLLRTDEPVRPHHLIANTLQARVALTQLRRNALRKPVRKMPNKVARPLPSCLLLPDSLHVMLRRTCAISCNFLALAAELVFPATNPKKTNSWDWKPETLTAETAAQGPGTGMTVIDSAAHAAASSMPGSEIP